MLQLRLRVEPSSWSSPYPCHQLPCSTWSACLMQQTTSQCSYLGQIPSLIALHALSFPIAPYPFKPLKDDLCCFGGSLTRELLQGAEMSPFEKGSMSAPSRGYIPSHLLLLSSDCPSSFILSRLRISFVILLLFACWSPFLSSPARSLGFKNLTIFRHSF